ncbi:winged helix-turn-helix DNA-binding domain-containing protein [Artemisia annua]|uniref:Winged helix-turn-helix DNA-binding domain-containing protein n=1 Tax=Artemisia annua TaxID=35608 RepID=A0A2U1PJ62_ARTAN|nr:winged helix-turn-helix DNA-binding domain-containing protein [Artemisia annua]
MEDDAKTLETSPITYKKLYHSSCFEYVKSNQRPKQFVSDGDEFRTMIIGNQGKANGSVDVSGCGGNDTNTNGYVIDAGSVEQAWLAKSRPYYMLSGPSTYEWMQSDYFLPLNACLALRLKQTMWMIAQLMTMWMIDVADVNSNVGPKNYKLGSRITHISVVVGPYVAASAVEAAVTALCEENEIPKEIFDTNENGWDHCKLRCTFNFSCILVRKKEFPFRIGRYVTGGVTWLNGAFGEVSKAGKVAQTKTRQQWKLVVSDLTANSQSYRTMC